MFAVVIGDVGVIIADLEEQRSYFGVIDFFLPATGNVREVRQEFQPPSPPQLFLSFFFSLFFFRGE